MPGGLGAFALVVAAGTLVLALIGVWLLARDKDVIRTSFGFYVERKRYDEDPPEKVTQQVQWPKREDEV